MRDKFTEVIAVTKSCFRTLGKQINLYFSFTTLYFESRCVWQGLPYSQLLCVISNIGQLYLLYIAPLHSAN